MPHNTERNTVPEAAIGCAAIETLGDRLADEIRNGHPRLCRGGLQTPLQLEVHAHGERLATCRNALDRRGRHMPTVRRRLYDDYPGAPGVRWRASRTANRNRDGLRDRSHGRPCAGRGL